jgi:hypothetical protein
MNKVISFLVVTSIMGTNLLSSISEYLETGIDECSNQHYDSTVRDGTLLDALTPR